MLSPRKRLIATRRFNSRPCCLSRARVMLVAMTRFVVISSLVPVHQIDAVQLRVHSLVDLWISNVERGMWNPGTPCTCHLRGLRYPLSFLRMSNLPLPPGRSHPSTDSTENISGMPSSYVTCWSSQRLAVQSSMKNKWSVVSMKV